MNGASGESSWPNTFEDATGAHVTGQSCENLVTEVMSMGCEGQQMTTALRAGFNYPDRAVGHLSLGTPEIEKLGRGLLSLQWLQLQPYTFWRSPLNSYGSASVSTDETKD
ncbi:hypothetical protein GH733_000724 [Mirounga leonina]|nr:hypothetical protein GH733_000724 [Mirounga leonina]